MGKTLAVINRMRAGENTDQPKLAQQDILAIGIWRGGLVDNCGNYGW